MTAYYNENDPKAAGWLRELIKAGHIAEGIVDERSIEDVTPVELAEFTQCHFFAGIGGWSYALRLAGWDDSCPVWTGSCPCQPFSAAGKGGGFADERHLWPSFFHLIKHGKPRDVPVLGEQVASKDGLAWLDLVQSDMEGEGYTIGAVDTCAAGFGAPHIRQRLYWVAHTGSRGVWRRQKHGGHSRAAGSLPSQIREQWIWSDDRANSTASKLGKPSSAGSQGQRGHGDGEAGWPQPGGPTTETNADGPLADATEPRYHEARQHECGSPQLSARPSEHGGVVRSGNPTNGLWRDADWLGCRDGKFRPVEPGTFPLAYGVPARVGRLRGYGNAIVPEVAAAFVGAYLDRR